MIEEAPQARRTAALAVADAGLGRAIRTALSSHPALALAPEPGSAQVLITDGPVPADPGVPVVVVSDDASPDGVAVLPPDEPQLVVAAAYLLASGYRVLRGVQHHGGDMGAADGGARLTPRERQVLDLLVSGASNKHIANALDISPHTAKFHVTAVLEKLGARNRSDAVGIALRDGHVTL